MDLNAIQSCFIEYLVFAACCPSEELIDEVYNTPSNSQFVKAYCSQLQSAAEVVSLNEQAFKQITTRALSFFPRA